MANPYYDKVYNNGTMIHRETKRLQTRDSMKAKLRM